MFWLETAGSVLGLICVWLTIKKNIWCWPTGLVQVILYCFIFYQVRLYSDLILHVVYIVLQIYGWYHWLYGGQNQSALPVTSVGDRGVVLWIFTGVLGTGMWGCLMGSYTDASLPYPDAFITVFSLIAQWLLTRKKIESWFFWICVDLVAIGVFFSKQLYMTGGLYCVFLGMATMGLFVWKKDFQSEKT